MKVIKYIILLLLLTIIGAALYVATLDGDYQIEESTLVDAPSELFYKTVANYKTWEEWSPWMNATDDMILSYPDKTTGAGASYTWKSEKFGDGNMLTIEAIPNKSLLQKREETIPYGQSTSEMYWRFETVKQKGTKITWGTKGKQRFVEKVLWLFKDQTISQTKRPMFKDGLDRLAAYVQKQMDVYSIHVDGITEHGGGFYMYSTVATTTAVIPQKIRQLLPAVEQYMKNNNIPITGQPFTLFNTMDDFNGTAIISGALPTRDKVIVPKDGNILCGFMEKQKMVKTTLKGNYTNLKEAWEIAKSYIDDNQLEELETGVPFEIYGNNPEKTANPAEWITEIYIPIN